MKNKLFTFFIGLVLLSLQSCEIIGGIFKAGAWVGFVLAALIVVIILWIVSKFRGKS